jgi:hypothetical protein
MGNNEGWLIYLIPAPILYLFSVVVAGTILWSLLKKQVSRRPSLIAAWMGATLSALVPQVLFSFVWFLQGEDYGFLFPSLALIPGAALVVLSLRRIFDVTPGQAFVVYGICLMWQAAATIPLWIIFRPFFMPGFYVYCVLLVVSLPIFLAFRSFKIPE